MVKIIAGSQLEFIIAERLKGIFREFREVDTI